MHLLPPIPVLVVQQHLPFHTLLSRTSSTSPPRASTPFAPTFTLTPPPPPPLALSSAPSTTPRAFLLLTNSKPPKRGPAATLFDTTAAQLYRLRLDHSSPSSCRHFPSFHLSLLLFLSFSLLPSFSISSFPLSSPSSLFASSPFQHPFFFLPSADLRGE